MTHVGPRATKTVIQDAGWAVCWDYPLRMDGLLPQGTAGGDAGQQRRAGLAVC